MQIQQILNIPGNIIKQMQHQTKDTASEIVNAIALAELEQTISIMCCDSE